MIVAAGAKLGRYEIRSKLGEGGMGEVYLAQDTKLDRKIALKILPAEVASNRDRMERFVREAKSAAALNHPHIAHIYEIGESEGLNFIAMEYIDGETLREKIHRDKAPLPRLLKYLTQVAEGLSKAHAAGIVHRDLKPDNIMITREGYAKILDFGLAKLVEPQKPFDSSDSGSSEIATAVMAQQSIPGMVMGTVGYMSPEQAQGKTKEIDHRSDIFSFGCILFEAATGKRAFEGKDVLDSLHRIVHAPTPQIRDFNAIAPDDLQRIVRRCLAKEPEKRFQSIKDVAIELEELQQELKGAAELEYSIQPASSGESTTGKESSAVTEGALKHASGSGTSDATRPLSSAEYLASEIKQHKRGVFLALAALVVVVTGTAFELYKWIGNRSRTVSAALKITRLTSTGKATSAAISPDGKYVVYAQDEGGQQSLWLSQVVVSSQNQIVPPAEVNYQGITFSHDGNLLYYVITDTNNPTGALYRIPVLGGGARKLLADIAGAITLSPDGKQIAFVRANRSPDETTLIVANADGAEEKKLAAHKFPDAFLTGGGPAWSPDGSIIACGYFNRTGGTYRNVLAVRVADGTEQPITSLRWGGQTGQRVAWLADNTGVLATGAEQGGSLPQIWYLPWPGVEGRHVTNDLNGYAGLTLTADSGTLSAVRSERAINLWIAPNGDASRTRQISFGAEREDGIAGLSWTPDGKIVYRSQAGGNENVWIMAADGRGNQQLSANASINIDPAVSPDGRYVVWSSRRAHNTNLWRMDIDGSNLKQLTSGVGERGPQISLDGKWVLYWVAGDLALFKIPIDGGDPARVTDKVASMPVFSPDGKLIACNYLDQASGQYKIAVIPFDGGSPIRSLDVPSPSYFRPLQWTPDGRAIAFIRNSNGVSNIWTQPLDGSAQKQLTDFKDQRIFNFAWSRDGKQLALSRGVLNSDVVLITGFKQ
ncbi:MAG: protein kinase domain-containing protein [Pyrinomonadaceae bacterium]